jgi:hypothetical protein
MDTRVQVECRKIGTLRLSALPNQMSWMQFSASRGGECARIGTLAQPTGPTANGWRREPMGAVATSPINWCLAGACCASGWDTGPVFSFETAQHVMFAQQSLLQASWLGAFDRMHDAAGSRSGVINTASKTVTRIADVFRIN